VAEEKGRLSSAPAGETFSATFIPNNHSTILKNIQPEKLMTTRYRIRTALSIATVAMAAVVFTTTSATAALVIEEPFNYTAGNIDTRNGGTGFDGAWVSTKSHGQDYQTGITDFNNGTGTTIDEDSGLFFSTLSVSGSALSRIGNAGRAQANRTISASGKCWEISLRIFSALSDSL